MLRVLDSAIELEGAQNAFTAGVKNLPHETVATSIGYQGGTYPTEVIWLPSLSIWAFFGLPPEEKSEGPRFWNAFGIGKPGALASIVCEINPSRGGVNRHTKGAFISDENRALLVCHRGMFNISGGMRQEFFRKHYRGTWIEAEEGNRPSTFVRVAELGTSDLGNAIKDFVIQVDQIKKLARAS
ncbi:MAG: hypothetical protein HYR70_06245 [Chloroflexi bacterium]|nr:hypothetical protein [Chloroflexota bacterium]MBI3338836.1 hypothetical protein [Chloroflexota bacterium]